MLIFNHPHWSILLQYGYMALWYAHILVLDSNMTVISLLHPCEDSLWHIGPGTSPGSSNLWLWEELYWSPHNHSTPEVTKQRSPNVAFCLSIHPNETLLLLNVCLFLLLNGENVSSVFLAFLWVGLAHFPNMLGPSCFNISIFLCQLIQTWFVPKLYAKLNYFYLPFQFSWFNELFDLVCKTNVYLFCTDSQVVLLCFIHHHRQTFFRLK